MCSFAGGVILLALAFVGLGSSVVPRIMGVQPYAIISGSMEPAYPTGSLVYAQPISGEDLQLGEVAAFWRDGDVIVHRVNSIDATEKEIVTKGDANDDVDLRPVSYRDVLGRVGGADVFSYLPTPPSPRCGGTRPGSATRASA